MKVAELQQKLLEAGSVEGSCIVWTGATSGGGYGRISVGKGVEIGGQRLRAGSHSVHRLAYMLSQGRVIDRNTHVLHHCDNPPCIRVDHLYAERY